MSSATFTLRAVDATAAAFASVQNSLGRLETATRGISKVTKLAFGGEAILGALNMMKQKLDSVASAEDNVGFSDEQIASAIRMEEIVKGALNFLMKIPLVMSQIGFGIGDLVSGISPDEIKAKIAAFRFDKSKKEIEGSVDATKDLQDQFTKLESTSSEWADTTHQMALDSFIQSQELFAQNKQLDKAFSLQQDGLKYLLEEATLRKKIAEDENKVNADHIDAFRKRKTLQTELDQLAAGGLKAEDALRLAYQDKLTAEQAIANLKRNDPGNIQTQITWENQLAETLQVILDLERQRRAFGMEFGSAIANSFEEAILSGNKLREVLRALGQDLLRMVFREQVTKPLAGGLGNFFANLFTGKATGGPVSDGTPYLVGEKGPELFVPNGSGSIVPNHRLGGGSSSGGSSVNVTYNIASGVNRAELVPILENERKRLMAQIPDMVRRGGSYRAAFA